MKDGAATMGQPTLELIPANPIDQALVKENITEKVIKELQKFKSLKIKGIEDKEGYKAANEARINCKNIRVLAVKVCKAGREDAIKTQKAWIAKENEVVGQISDVETYLENEQARIDNEKEAIRLAAEKAEAERMQSRVKALFDNGCTYDGVNYSIGETTINDTQLKVMDDNIFEPFLDRVKVEHARELEMKEQAEKERLAEVARIEAEKQAEAERMRKEREELERQQAEFKAQQEAARKEREEAEAKVKAEADRIAKAQAEAQAEINRQAELLRKEKEAAELAEKRRLQVIEDERIAKEKEALRIETERLAAIEAENQRIAKEREEAEAARIEQERQAALAPDKDKLIAYADALAAVPLPAMTSEATDKILTDAVGLVAKIQQFINKQTKAL